MRLLPRELYDRHIAGMQIFEGDEISGQDLVRWANETLLCVHWLDTEGQRIASDLHFEAALACLARAQKRVHTITSLDDLGGKISAALEGTRGNALRCLGELQGSENHLLASVAACRKALEFYNANTSPTQWAGTQSNLGNALKSLGGLRGSQHHLVSAVEAYRAALSMQEVETARKDWAATQNNLGGALLRLGALKGCEHDLICAVVAYRAAIGVFEKDTNSKAWSAAQSNLGAALLQLGEMRSRTEDLLDAVGAFRSALTVRSEKALPSGWATTKTSLGGALTSLGVLRHREQDLLDAAESHRDALRVRNKSTNPLGWAATQNALGGTLLSLGTAFGQVQKILEAVGAYRAALTVYYERTTPADWVKTMGNLAIALRRIGSDNELAATARLDAKSRALSALPHFAEGAEPRHYLNTLKIALELGAGLGELGDDVAVHAATQMRLALQQAGDRDGRRHILKEVGGLSDRLTCAALRDGERQDQLPVFLDLTRARELGRRIEITERGMTPDERKDLEQLRSRMRDRKRAIEKARTDGREADAGTMSADLRDINRQIEALFTAVETRLHLDPEQSLPLPLGAMQRDIGAARLSALLSVVSDDHGGFVLMIPAEGPIRVTPLPQTSHQDFDDLVDDWLKTYRRCFSSIGTKGQMQAQAAQDWEAHLQSSLPGLWARAGETMVEALSDAGLGPDSQVALLLPGQLSLLPWEAALAPDGKSLRDHALISRIPSVRALATLAARPKRADPASDRVLMVTDPRNDLKAVGITANPAESAFSAEQCAALTGDAATLEAVTDALPKANILSLFLHGNWGGAKAEESCLALAGDDLLFAADLDESMLPDCHTVVIGACESGNTALEAPDEFDGLPAAFFSAGASSVIATLWPVLTIPTHETMSHLFKGLAEGKTAASALRDALADRPSDQSTNLQTNKIVLEDEDSPPLPEAPVRTKYPLSNSAAFFTFGR